MSTPTVGSFRIRHGVDSLPEPSNFAERTAGSGTAPRPPPHRPGTQLLLSDQFRAMSSPRCSAAPLAPRQPTTIVRRAVNGTATRARQTSAMHRRNPSLRGNGPLGQRFAMNRHAARRPESVLISPTQRPALEFTPACPGCGSQGYVRYMSVGKQFLLVGKCPHCSTASTSDACQGT